jgi:glycosyltransferase 2 family protein
VSLLFGVVAVSMERIRGWVANPHVRRGTQIVITVLILVFLGLAVYDLAPKFAAYDWQLEPGWLAVALVILVVRGPLPVWGWSLILHKLGYRISFRKSTRIVYYSALAAYLPGSMWHYVGRVYLAEKEGVPRLRAVISIAIESVLILLAAVAVAGLSLAAWPEPPLWAAALALVLLVGVIWRPDLFFKLVDWGLQKIGRKALGVHLSSKDVLEILVPFVLNWISFGLIFFALLAALYPGLSLLYIPAVSGIFTAAWVGGYLAIVVPQGLGVREFIIVTLLAVLGVPAPVATAAALLARLWSILGAGVWGAISAGLREK